jgi:hypothetical protein
VTASASLSARVGSAVERVQARQRTLGRVVWLVPTLSLVVIVGIFIPRFGVKSPSLVDDWFALTYSPTATHQLLHGHYNAATVDYGGRYRPSYALLGELQWMLGSRNSTLIPNVVGLIRLLFFAGVVAATVVALLRGTASRRWLIVAASVVPMAVIATRGEAYNFVRFGVGEPTAFALIALGLIGMTAAVRRQFRSPRTGAIRTAIIFAAGYAMYVFGAYMSESCVAVVVLLPAFYFWVTRAPGFIATRRSKTTLAATGALIVAPVVHVVLKIVPMLGGDAEGARTSAGFASQLGRPAVSTLAGILSTADPAWPIVTAVTLVVILRRALGGDRHAVLLAGMVASGFAAAYVANLGTSGNALSRYYIPLLVTIGVASMWLLQSLQPSTRSLVLASVLAIVLAGRGDQTAKGWLYLDHAGGAAIAMSSEAYSTGCAVYLVGFPEERRMGLARMMGTGVRTSLARCSGAGSKSAYAVWWRLTAHSNSSIDLGGCATDWRRIAERNFVELSRCSDFRPAGLIRTQDTLVGARVVRLVPPGHWIDASQVNRLAYVDH